MYRSGVLVQVPRPERFAIHKLIVADRRQHGPDALKAHKDRAQAALDPGPAWRKRILSSLRRMPATAELLQS
ncbi:GSU2403 family nucleotidyltransferase fold protein [Roseibium sp. MMSF_3361]|uniref:GSU2403 family nucleotidyltransferase fold protein n=1 Tax=unclassified Roseibium TaxID=2629323 RepID=UPI003531BF69